MTFGDRSFSLLHVVGPVGYFSWDEASKALVLCATGPHFLRGLMATHPLCWQTGCWGFRGMGLFLVRARFQGWHMLWKLIGARFAIKDGRRFSSLLLWHKACCWGLLHRVGLSTSRCSYKFGYIWLSSYVGVQSFHTCIPQKSNGYFPPSTNFKENTLTKHC